MFDKAELLSTNESTACVELIEKNHPVSAYCLSYSGINPALVSEMLNYILNKTDIKIKTVVMEAYPYKILVPFEIQDTRVFTDSPAALKSSILASFTHNRNVKIADIFELVVTSDNESLITYPINNSIIERFYYKGGYIRKFLPGLKTFSNRDVLPSVNLFSKLQSDSYIEIAALCKIKGINLIFVEPFLPSHTQGCATYKYAKDVLLKTVSPTKCTFVESKAVSLDSNDPELFSDDLHLSSKGRELWTRDIARLIVSR